MEYDAIQAEGRSNENWNLFFPMSKSCEFLVQALGKKAVRNRLLKENVRKKLSKMGRALHMERKKKKI